MRPSTVNDPFRILGLPRDAGVDQVRAAWRSLSQSQHPDAGGSHESMVMLNDAYERAMATFSAATRSRKGVVPSDPIERRLRMRREESAFTIDVLPVEAFHALEVVAAECGPTIQDDPPYMIEFMLHDAPIEGAIDSWCRCDLVPEAGATTVHVAIGTVDGAVAPSIESVRDLLVGGLNSIDWPA